jgi:hypothetical protein
MADLSATEIIALANAARVKIPSELLAEVSNNLNGMLEALAAIDVPGLDEVEPLPIIVPPISATGN